MRTNKLLSMLLCIPLLVFSMSACTDRKGEKGKIAVIVKALDSDFWRSVKSGVDSAAAEYNVNVTFDGPKNEEDYVNQNKLIMSAVKNGADAIVLSAIDCEKSVDAVNKAAEKGVKVIIIDSNVNSKKVSMFIGTNNADAGRRAGKAAIGCVPSGEEINIGLINYYKSTENGIQRENGFRGYIDDVSNANIAVSVNVNSNTESVVSAVTALLAENPEVNVLVGFNEWMTLGIGTAIQHLGLAGKVHVVGFDTNTAAVGMLETGVINTLIVQNPFAIGYLGVKNATELISGESVSQKEIYTDTVAVNRENLFDKDIQKMVFRFN